MIEFIIVFLNALVFRAGKLIRKWFQTRSHAVFDSIDHPKNDRDAAILQAQLWSGL